MSIAKLLEETPEHKRDALKKDLLKSNINQAQEVLFKAEIANKGRHVHDINASMRKLEYLLKHESTKDVTSEQFANMCKTKHHLAALLYYAQNAL